MKAWLRSKISRVKGRARRRVAELADRLSRHAVWLLTRRRSRADQHVIVLADFLDFSRLLNCDALSDESVVVFATSRYRFLKLLGPARRNVVAVEPVEGFTLDYADEITERVARYNPKAILIQSGEFLMPMANHLTRHFGLRGNSEDATRASFDKLVMRQRFAEAGVATVRHIEIHGEADLDRVDFFPCVVKPAIGTRSAGAFKVDHPDDLRRMLQESRDDTINSGFPTSYMVEEYIEGRQMEVDGVMVDGELFIVDLCDESFEDYPPSFRYAWWCHGVPATPEAKEWIRHTINHAIKAMGIEHGSIQAEFKITENGEIKIIEISNRIGTEFENDIERASGNCIVDIYARTMLGLPVDPPPHRGHSVLMRKHPNEADVDAWRTYAAQHDLPWSYQGYRHQGFVGTSRLHTENFDDVQQLLDTLRGDSRPPMTLP